MRSAPRGPRYRGNAIRTATAALAATALFAGLGLALAVGETASRSGPLLSPDGLLASTPARGDATPRVTFVGDSISASLDYVPSARRLLSRGFRMHFDLEVCRRLATTSCSFQGRTPTTALQAVRSLGRSVGDVLVVHVGYNEGSSGYQQGMRRVIRTALAAGARGVVWVTLKEANSIYRPTNAVIRREAKRWPSVEVADWATHNRGRPWFREDGLHLNAAGAAGLARLVRAHVLRLV